MELFHDMKRYSTGQSPGGDETFSVPLEPDEDGLIGRECPEEDCQPKYFKMSLSIPDDIHETIEDFSQMAVTCPYCGTVENMQHFHTESQAEWIKSMIFRDVAKSFQDMMGDIFKPTTHSSSGMFSVSIKYTPGSLPSVRHYVEEQLKQTVTCDNCGFNYAVYGISFHCPLCGEGNLIQHLERSARIIKVLLEEAAEVGKKRGQEIGEQMVGNALEDVVGLFEAFLKHIFRYEMKRRLTKEEAENKINRIRTNFQRLEGAEKFFAEELQVSLFDACSSQERDFLQEQFLKRHVLTHNLGLVDKKYLERAKAFERQGEELTVSSEDVETALEIVTSIIKAASSKLTASNE